MSIFGDFLEKFKFDNPDEERIQTNQIADENDDGAIEFSEGYYQNFLNFDPKYSDQAALIEDYREIANYELVDLAIDDIINEMVSFHENEEPVELDLTGLEDDLSENVRTKVYEAWGKITRVMELKKTIYKKARDFYIDGRATYQKVIDKKRPKDGILKVVQLDPRFVSKVKQTEYDKQTKAITGIIEKIIYNENVGTNKKNKKTDRNQYIEAVELNPDAVVYVTTGMTDDKTGYAVSYLHKAVKPVNQLRMMENALLIYRITRAPERRVFYVDTSKLQKSKGQAYLKKLQQSYRNKMQFDPEKGTFKDGKAFYTMQEDFWLPRDSNGKGTEVTTLPGGQNLGDIEDIVYFQKKVYKSLNLPVSRLEPESTFMGGRTTEITRDELKFSKFVSRVRTRFNEVFIDLLRTECILTKIMTAKEFDDIKDKLTFNYSHDLYLEEATRNEILQERLNIVRDLENHVGKYVSHGYIRREIFKQNEEEIKELDKEIQKEKTIEQYQPKEEESRF